MSKTSLISVIIPCYNHGIFIDEAVQSVLEYKNLDYEIIIVNDGSTDPFTIDKLADLEKKGFNVINQTNKGLGAARNTGIKAASGKYILPLDADNKIKPEYIYKSIYILNSNSADIVYGKPTFFGEKIPDREYIVKPFDGEQLYLGNYIDACAVFKKEVWINLGGYDETMPFNGFEDWEFWLNAYINQYKFHFLDEELYYYRILGNSMFALSGSIEKKKITKDYIYKKHALFFEEAVRQLYSYKQIYIRDLNNPLRSSLKFFWRFIRKLLIKTKASFN